MGRTVYIADDDIVLRDTISAYLVQDGCEVKDFETGDALLDGCKELLPDLVVLDIMMPGTDGLSCCSMLRSSHPDLGIIIISAKGSPYDRITALSLGSDDYLVKPFLPLELVMRTRAILRRCEWTSKPTEDLQELNFGPLKILPIQRLALLDGEPFALAPTEFDFLTYMIRQPAYTSSREDLLKNLWQIDWQSDTRATDHVVKRLRRKLSDRHCPARIETIWGYGFRLALQGTDTPKPMTTQK